MVLQKCEEPFFKLMDHTSPASRQAAALLQIPQAVPGGSHSALRREADAQGHPFQAPQQDGQLVPSQTNDGKPQETTTQSGDPQHAGQVPEMASSQHESPRPPSEQHLLRQARDMGLDSAAPATLGNPLCPSLNLNFSTQVASLQPPCAAQSQEPGHAESSVHQASRTEPPANEAGLPVVCTDGRRLREGTSVAAEAARAADALTCTEETAREEGARVTFSPAAQSVTEEQLGLCLRLDDTQIEAQPGANKQAGKGSLEAGAVIPDTMEPCSSSKETPKSKQQVVPVEQPPEPASAQREGLPAAAQGEEGTLAKAQGEAGRQHQDVLLQHGYSGAPGNAQQPARR